MARIATVVIDAAFAGPGDRRRVRETRAAAPLLSTSTRERSVAAAGRIVQQMRAAERTTVRWMRLAELVPGWCGCMGRRSRGEEQ